LSAVVEKELFEHRCRVAVVMQFGCE